LTLEDEAMRRLIILCFLLCVCGTSYAKDRLVYSISGGFGPPYLVQIDAINGQITDVVTNLHGYSGRGVAVVGDTLYYTAVLPSCVVLCYQFYTPPGVSSYVYSYNLRTHTDNGILFSVPVGIAGVAYDGKDFYFSDGSGSNNVYRYSITGSLLATITLSRCVGPCVGLEYVERGGVGYLISSRGFQKGPYDLYDLSGNLVIDSFIDPSRLINNQGASTPTGITFDGAHFYTTGWLGNGELEVWDTNGSFVKEIVPSGWPQGIGRGGFQDLSFDYCLVLHGNRQKDQRCH
jgi:hypothetical protein